jgi:hypothetical protein
MRQGALGDTPADPARSWLSNPRAAMLRYPVVCQSLYETWHDHDMTWPLLDSRYESNKVTSLHYPRPVLVIRHDGVQTRLPQIDSASRYVNLQFRSQVPVQFHPAQPSQCLEEWVKFT